MADLFSSGRLVDLILALTVIEAACLIVYWRSRGRGIAPLDLLPNLFAGVFLLLALRLALSGAGWEICCGSLAAAGMSHIVDLVRRWRR